MTKKPKYCIILTVIMVSLITSICVASGPGDDIHDGSEWKLSEDFIGSIANFWCRWVPIHFGTGVDAKLRDGEAAGSDIIYIDRTEGRSDDVTSVGYGLYQMDLRKHMVGYLYYLKSKASKDNPSSIAKQQMEHEEAGGSGVPETLKLKEACKYVADRLITTAYSKDTVTKYLDPILTDIEGMLGASEIKKHQSDFWYKVYGQKAYSLLTGSLGFSVPLIDLDKRKNKIQGAILSIMEDRYRNKTLKNKTTMQLSVEKGDLWPFLVYTETEDNGAHTLWKYKEKENDTTYKTTDWEKMLEGAYQYMVYYEYKVDEEADSTDYITLYNGAKAEIFYSEYEELFGHPLRELKGEELDLFYQRIRRIRRYYKKSQDNSGGIFGEEEYDQSSDIAYSQAIQAIENKMNTEPFKSVFKSLDTENIARTYTMAKNIAANTRMIEQNVQYDIGSNIITRTPGGYDNNVLLTDLQLITLERDQNTGKYTDDADMDGLTDGFELGSDEGTYVNTNITGFIRQMMVAEGGEENADYLLNMYMQNIKDAKNDPEKMNKQDAQRDLRVEGNQIYVNLMSYTSNPIFKDTDFDGVWDGYGYDDSGNPIKENERNDSLPLDSKISGTITTVENKTQDFETHMDYRYFFLDQYNYYDELSTMSLLLSNAVYDRNFENLSNLTKVNEKIGLNLDYRTVEEDKVKPYNYKYKTKYAIGYKPVEYSKNNSTEPDKYIKKLIIPVVIPGMTEISDGSSYSEIGSVNWADKDKPDIVDPESHNVKSYEMYASMILSDIESYERTVIEHDNLIDSDYKKVYWVTGYKEGGAIANILASKLIDNNNIVYSYTFGSPMTLYNNPDEGTYSRTGYRARYDSIFNVINTRDAYTFVMPQNLGFSRYGQTCYGGLDIYDPIKNRFTTNEESVMQIIDAFDKLYEGYEDKTRDKTYEKNKTYLGYYNVIRRLICAIDKDRNNKDNSEDDLTKFYNRYKDVTNIIPLINAINIHYNNIKAAGTDDIYYRISKLIRNEDIQNTVNYYDNKKKRNREMNNSAYLSAIGVMSDWYVNNIPTYQSSLQTEGITNLNNYIKKLNYIKDYKLKDKNGVEGNYKVATNDTKNSVKKSSCSNATKILKGTEEAVQNYNTNYTRITFPGLAYYPCADINTGTDSYKTAGDDCVRFAFSCFKKFNQNFISDLNSYSGLEWHEINSTLLAGKSDRKENNDKITYAMSKLGFEIYDIDGDNKPIDYNRDGKIDYTINAINSDFKLKAGDFVACDGHVHFCLEDDNEDSSNDKKDNFGWGSVYREYPKNYSFIVEGIGGNKYQINGSGMEYNRVYRYNR